jgi:hypothetical protein
LNGKEEKINMAWFRFENCTIEAVEYDETDLGSVTLHILNDEIKEKLKESYKFSFVATDHKTQLEEVKNGLRDRCYFAFGMQDIDVFKIDDKFALLHSPYETENRVFILADGEFDKLIANKNWNFIV